MPESATNLYTAINDGDFDINDANGVTTVRLTPPSLEDNPPTDTLYVNVRLNTSHIANGPTAAAQTFLSDRSVLFTTLADEIDGVIPRTHDPLGNAVLQTTASHVIFRVAFPFPSGTNVHTLTARVEEVVGNQTLMRVATSLGVNDASLVAANLIDPLITPVLHVGECCVCVSMCVCVCVCVYVCGCVLG